MLQTLQGEQNDQRLSNSGAPCQYPEDIEPQNGPSNIPLPVAHGHDDGTSGCSTSVSYPVMQFKVAELRRRRKHRFMVSHENGIHCSNKTAR
jgi:DNA mismatch repair protein PMS2